MDTIKKDTNKTYGETLTRLGKTNKNIIVLEADLAKASGSLPFKDAFPDRHINVGIAEQNLVSVAAGVAASGKIPFASTFACFASQRACDQAMNSVAYNNYNVKIVGTYAGLTSEKNGGTHISIADLSIFRSMPNFVVIDPGDAVEYEKVIEFAADYVGPMYIRANKGVHSVFHKEDYTFSLGKAEVLQEGNDIALITTGITTNEGIAACAKLAQEGISVYHIHMPTIKPIDVEAIKVAAKFGKIITAENHSIIGGLGSSVAEILSEHCPTKLIRLGLNDCFGETATLAYMMHKHKIDAEGIAEAIKSNI